MIELEMARQLLELAEDDAKALRAMLQSDQFHIRISGFQAQQAAEKALKAWLVVLDVDFPLTHSISALLSLLRIGGADCARYDALKALTPYAVEVRYGASETETAVDPATVLPLIADLLAHVRGLLEIAEAGE